MCRMKNYRMKMQSTLPAMEIEVDRNDSYAELVNRAAEAFNLSESLERY